MAFFCPFHFDSPSLSQIGAAQTEATPASGAADRPHCDLNESSCQSHTSSSSNQPEGRPGSSQTQISTGATSCTLDDIDTDSSIPSVSEQNYSNGVPLGAVNPAAYLSADTYSIVGSLNPSSRATACMNGTSGGAGLFPAGMPLLNVCRLPGKEEATPAPPLALPGGTLGKVAAAPLRMEDLLNRRLDQVTFDLSQPPYDSLQTYEFEGRDSRAESLSSLESDGEKDAGRVVGGMEELNQKFQRLVEIIREREKEKEAGGGGGGVAADSSQDETCKQKEVNEKEQQKWDF